MDAYIGLVLVLKAFAVITYRLVPGYLLIAKAGV